MTLQELIERAVDIANQGMDSAPTRVSAELATEPMVSSAFYYAARRAAADPNKRPLVTTDQTVVLTNGVGTLPTTVLVEYMPWAAVADPADATMAHKMRHVRSWSEFIRPLESTLGYYTASNIDQFHLTRPGSAYTPGAGMTGNITLTIASVPAVPGAPNGTINAPGELLDSILLTLAAALRGDWQKAAIKEAV